MKICLPLLGLGLLALGCGKAQVEQPEPLSNVALTVTSHSFSEGGTIPDKFTNYGANVSPALNWSLGPQGTAAYALILEDPDAPGSSPFVHWLVYDIPAAITGFEEGRAAPGAKEGQNDAGSSGYFGPRPPSGTHHYRFKIFALSRSTGLAKGASKAQFLAAVKDRVLAEGMLTGLVSH